MANTVDKVISIAEAEVGYLEKKSNSQLYDKTANAGSANYTKYGKEMHDIYPTVMDFPASWCDAFCDWCFYKAYGVSTAKSLIGGNFDDYTVASAQMYKNKGAWHTSNPKIGDQIFFKNSTRICHTGLVYKVDNKYVYTIEGNTSGASGVIANGGGVCKKKYLLSYENIAGYGRPKYDSNAKYAIGWNKDDKGIWYSPDGNTYYKSKFVNIDGYRFYFDKSGYAVKDWHKIDGKWYYFETTNGETQYALYVSDSNGVQAPGIFGAKSGTVYNCSSLNVRSENTASSNLITSITAGTKVTILKESNGWYYVKLSDGTKGWVSGKYIQTK